MKRKSTRWTAITLGVAVVGAMAACYLWGKATPNKQTAAPTETPAAKPALSRLYATPIQNVLAELQTLNIDKDYIDAVTGELLWINDTTAIRMELLPQSVWDSLPVCNYQQNFDTTDQRGVTIRPSMLQLQPKNGTKVLREKYAYHDPTNQGRDSSSWADYLGRDAGLNLWKIDRGMTQSTAGISWNEYLDCTTGRITMSCYGEVAIHTDKSRVCEWYHNDHDSDNYMSVMQPGDSIRQYIGLDPIEMVAVAAQWISDSSLRVQMVYHNIPYEYETAPEVHERLQALIYRVLYIRPFKKQRPIVVE